MCERFRPYTHTPNPDLGKTPCFDLINYFPHVLDYADFELSDLS